MGLRDTFAKNLRAARLERGWSQEELAFEAGLHRTYVSAVERGIKNISIDNIERLAKTLKVKPADLLL